MESVEAEAQRSDVPLEVLAREVERYAREIVPSFNIYLYFRIGYYLARRILQFLYRVRLGYGRRRGTGQNRAYREHRFSDESSQ